MKTPLSLARAVPKVEITIVGLSLVKYHVKNGSDVFLSQENIHDSAKCFARVMDKLWADEVCRSFVVFPLCLRQDGSDYSIVFPRLSDYRIGLPSDRSLPRS